ncbi:hypothetical protein DB346_15985 [Verrucomicrobia bacterium LW23]|nr:hypothetical protein DB346_15985 [Verrucomicrobia bacterium LW23]
MGSRTRMLLCGMKRYLDPKNDLVFKRIFGQHPNVLRAFLNALLPLEQHERIDSLEYLTPEQTPEIPVIKHTIVDVRCRDVSGRQFIVEMQMQWTTAFLQRVLFNASRAYVHQLDRGEEYELLQPVYGLSLLNDVYAPDHKGFYHHYKIVAVEEPDLEIKGLQLVFVELPKFEARGTDQARELWLRFLSETGKNEKAPVEIGEQGEEFRQALSLAEEAAYTREELHAYDRYWDAVSTEKTLIAGKFREGLAEGQALGLRKGRAEGRALGRAEGRAEALAQALASMVASGVPEAEARRMLGI